MGGIEALPATDQVELGSFMAFWESQVGLNDWKPIRQLTHQMLVQKCGQSADCGESELTHVLRKLWTANTEQLILAVCSGQQSISEAQLTVWAKQNPSEAARLLPNPNALDESQGGYCQLLGLPAAWRLPTNEFTSKVVDAMHA